MRKPGFFISLSPGQLFFKHSDLFCQFIDSHFFSEALCDYVSLRLIQSPGGPMEIEHHP
jgi:hypothetical protein